MRFLALLAFFACFEQIPVIIQLDYLAFLKIKGSLQIHDRVGLDKIVDPVKVKGVGDFFDFVRLSGESYLGILAF